MSTSINLSKMIFDTDYESLDYRQIVELDLAFAWANEIIKSLLPVKKQKEIEAFTSNYLAKHSVAGTVPIANPGESIKEDALNTTIAKDETIQETPAITPEKKEESVLERPMSVEECPDIVKQAIEMAETIPVPDGTIASSPYFVCYMFKTSRGKLVLFEKPYGWNAPAGIIEKLKDVEPLYAGSHYKTLKTYCVGDYVVSTLVKNQCRVCYYKTDGVEMEKEYDNSSLPDDIKRGIELSQWLDNYKENDEEPTNDSPTEDTTTTEDAEWVDNAVTFDIKSSVPKKKKNPRCVAIVGTKGGETRKWNSFRDCERDLGVSPGTASQVVSGKMKNAKGWKLRRDEGSAE